jgi:hypothetical protein
MPDRPLALGPQVILEPNDDVEAVAAASEQLRRELLELDVDAVVPAPGEKPPPGSRAGGVGEAGELIVTVDSSGLFTTVVEVVRTWLEGQRERSLTLLIDGAVFELTKLSSGERSGLADQWLARHTDS